MWTGKDLMLAITLIEILWSDKCMRIKTNRFTAALLETKLENVYILEILRRVRIAIQTMKQWYHW
jgi:hypothetical protein